MKVALIWVAAMGLCATAEAGSRGFGSPIIEPGTSYQEPLQSFRMESIPAELDYSLYLGTAAFLAKERSASTPPWQLPSEPAQAPIVIAGLAFLAVAGALRTVPILRHRLHARRREREGHHGRRRRVKVEMRMMA